MHEKVKQLPGCQRKLAVISGASDAVISPRCAIWDKVRKAVTESECRTTTGRFLCVKYTARDENGKDDIEGLVGAVRDSWNAAISPTFTSGAQKTTFESTEKRQNMNIACSMQHRRTNGRL